MGDLAQAFAGVDPIPSILGKYLKTKRRTRRAADAVSRLHGIDGTRPIEWRVTFNRQPLNLGREHDNFRGRATHESDDARSNSAKFRRLLDGASQAGFLAENRPVQSLHSPACGLVKNDRELLITAAHRCTVDHQSSLCSMSLRKGCSGRGTIRRQM